MNKLIILYWAILGELLKLAFKFKLIKINTNGINVNEIRKEKVVISLTSYGRRVVNILPYTLYSLLNQSYKPDVILLWLDKEHWSQNNIPESIKNIQKYGITIMYCNDIKSYKKLIPTLNLYPNDIIITCDDDVYYRRNMVELLVNSYKNNPKHVYVHRAHRLRFDNMGNLLPYNDWHLDVSGETNKRIFPTGVGGCLYKKSFFHKDICNEKLFMELAPKADDIWFYFMEFLNGIECSVLPKNGYIYIPLDVFYQYFNTDASLSNDNCKDSQNDVQIKRVMEYYQIKSIDLS